MYVFIILSKTFRSIDVRNLTELQKFKKNLLLFKLRYSYRKLVIHVKLQHVLIIKMMQQCYDILLTFTCNSSKLK